MAKVERRTDKDGGLYTTRVYLGVDPRTGKHRQKRVSARTKKELADKVAELRHKSNTGAYVDDGRLRLADYLEDWLPSARRRLRPSSYRTYEHEIRARIIPALGTARVGKLRPVDVQAFYDGLLDAGLSPTSVRKVHGILRRALNEGVRAGVIARNVCDRVSPPGAAKPELTTWTAEQAAHFIAATADDPLGLLWHLAIVTGMRRGELIALRWADVDLARGQLAVRHTQTVDLEGQLTIGPPKAGERTVALPPHMLTLLREHQDAQRARLEEHAWKWTPDVFVFDRGDGHFYRPEYIGQAFRRAIKAAGVPAIRFHDLRHSSASLLLAAGVNVKVVQERLGHHSSSFTLDNYAHTTESMQAEAARRLAETLGLEAGFDQIVTESPAGLSETAPESENRE